ALSAYPRLDSWPGSRAGISVRRRERLSSLAAGRRMALLLSSGGSGCSLAGWRLAFRDPAPRDAGLCRARRARREDPHDLAAENNREESDVASVPICELSQI